MDKADKLELLSMLCDMQAVKRDDKRAIKIATLRNELGIIITEKTKVWTEAHNQCQRSIDRISKMIAFSESRYRRQELGILRDLLAEHLQDDDLTCETVKAFNCHHVVPIIPKGFGA